MKIKPWHFLRTNIYPLLLLAICLVIISLNHVSGTYLSGWDTLHPEFNFPLSLERITFGVFRSEQGLGAVAAHSHMAELPRVLILWLMSIAVPDSLLRFVYIAACLPIGVLGVYFFVKRVVLRHLDRIPASGYAFTAGLFYLFNLGTLQHFYVPFEMFQTQYAFLPWLFLGAFNFLESPSKKNLAIFSLVSFLSMPMAFASTLWFAYFLSLVLFLLFLVRGHFRHVFLLIVGTLLINSFWLLPNMYFLLSGNAANIPDAKINKIFSEEAFINNKNFGDFADATILKNYLFNWPVYQGDNHFGYVLEVWRNYLSNAWIMLIGYIFSGFVLIGTVKSLFANNRFTKALLLPGVMAFVFLISDTAQVGWLFAFLRDHSDIFKEALRFPFTKFSIILMFAASCFFGLGQSVIYELLVKLKIAKVHLIQVVLILSLSIVYCLPFFQGQLISKYVQVKIPSSYFEMFDWFNSQPQGRIANLPVHSFWGWMYYDWGFQGAQFISFGIKQPILDRDYDRWNPANEDYYRQISYAVYSQNLNLVEQVLNKYNIKYLLLDENVTNPGVVANKEVLFYDQIKKIIASSSKIKLIKTFGKVSVFEYIAGRPGEINALNEFSVVQSPEGPYEVDVTYLDHGNYINSDLGRAVYPFKSISDNENFLNSKFISQENDILSLKFVDLPGQVKLNLANYLDAETQLPTAVYLDKNQAKPVIKLVYRLPVVGGTEADNENIESIRVPDNIESDYFINFNNQQTLHVVSDPKLLGKNDQYGYFLGNVFMSTKNLNMINFYTSEGKPLGKNYSLNGELLSSPVKLCGDSKPGQVFYSTVVPLNEGFKIVAKNSKVCVRFPLNKIVSSSDVDDNDLLKIHFRVNADTQLRGQYCIFDRMANRCIKERLLLETGINVNDYLSLNLSDLEKYELVFYLNAEEAKNLSDVSYQDIGLRLLHPNESQYLDLTGLRAKIATDNLTLNRGSRVDVNFPSYLSVAQPNLLKANNKSSFCSNFTPIKYDRRVDNSQGYVEYSSVGGSSCDFFEFPDLSHQSGYILTLITKTTTGLPLRICVANTVTKRCDLYTSLPKNSDFRKVSIMIPPTSDGGYGYNIHFDNYSIGHIETVNQVKDLRIVPFPYAWVNQMEFESIDTQEGTSSVSIIKNQTILPGLIRLDYSNQSESEGLIELDRSFENGWVSLGKKHVLMNDWANGWIIPGSSKGSMWIFYWPQMLELFGFLLLGGWIIRLARP